MGTGAGGGERWALGIQIRPFPAAMHAASRVDFQLVQACGVYGASNSAPKIEKFHARQCSGVQRRCRQMSRRTRRLLGPVQISFGHPWFRRRPRTQARSARPKRNCRSACEHLFLLHERRVVASGTRRHRRLGLGWSWGFSNRTHGGRDVRSLPLADAPVAEKLLAGESTRPGMHLSAWPSLRSTVDMTPKSTSVVRKSSRDADLG